MLYPDYIYIDSKNKSYESINLLISTVGLDCDGLPFLTEREVNALVDYCLLIHYQKAIGLGKIDYNFINYLKQNWSRNCRNARVSQTVNQNYLDSILNVYVSMDIKQYNRPYKLFKDV
jgi:hypothetical protein